MGFLSTDYRTQLSPDQQKKQTAKPAPSKPTKSTANKVGGFLNAAGRAVFKNTAKFANQSYQEGKQVVDTAKIITADATNNDKALSNAVSQSDKDRQGFKDKGGLFNAGTFNTEEEAKRGDFKSGAEKIGAGTVGVASEILPFAKGIGIEAKALPYVAKGVTLAKDTSKAAKAIKAAKLLTEGAGYGLVNSGVDSVTEDKPLSGSDAAQSALIGAGSAGIGGLIGKGLGKIVGRGGSKVAEDVAPNYNDTELDQFLPKKIPVTQADESVAGIVSKNGLPENTPIATALDTAPINDTDFRLKFNGGAKEAVKLPQIAKTAALSGSSDPTTVVISHLVDAKSTKNIIPIVKKLVPNLTTKENRELAVKLKDAGKEETVKELLNGAAQNTQANPTPIAPATKISFDAPATPAQRASAALVGEGGDSISERVSPSGYTQPSLTTNIDTRLTGVEDAKNTIALSRTDTPSISTSVSAPQRAQAALIGDSGSSISAKADEPVTAVGKGAQAIGDRLDDFDKNLAVPKSLVKAIDDTGAAKAAERKHSWLNRYEDTLSVLGRFFGKAGTDIGYKFAEGASQLAQLQETVLPNLKNAQKLLKKVAKTEAGRKEVQSRIYDALENRSNADQYLHNDKEKKLYNEVVAVFDFFKAERQKRGLSVVGEDYSPRTAVANALEAPDRLFNRAQNAFPKGVASPFSKARVSEIPDVDINKNIVDLLPQYVSSQSREFAYGGALDFARKELGNVDISHLTNGKLNTEGVKYLSTLMSQVLDPARLSSFERFQNKLIGNTYRNQLGLSPKFALQNLTQRFLTKSVVSKEATRLAGGGTGRLSSENRLDTADIDALRQEMISGTNPIVSEALDARDGSTSKVDDFFKRFDPGARTEKGNVHNAFDSGVAQAVVESPEYKNAIKTGLLPREASKHALQDPQLRELAIRRGNIVVNDTQFGANFVTKPEYFRESKTIGFISDKWYKQYQRFPQGMLQNMSTILRANDARALDILKRGNPAETNIVEFRNSAQALHNGVSELIKGIKAGEVHDVSLDVAQGYQKQLGAAIKELNSQMKKVSQIRGHKTAAAGAKMWAGAAAIQFLFDGGLSMSGDIFALSGNPIADERNKSLKFGSPLSIPTKDQNPLSGAVIPSSPLRPNGDFDASKLANLIPGVGLAVSRGKEIKRFADALTGDSSQ